MTLSVMAQMLSNASGKMGRYLVKNKEFAQLGTREQCNFTRSAQTGVMRQA